MLSDIINVLVPLIAEEAKKKIDCTPDEKHQWVLGLVHEMMALLDKKLPSWAKPFEPEIEAIVSDLLAKVFQ